ETLATGTFWTVTAADPLMLPTEARMVAEPRAAALTVPVLLTEAIAGEDDDHVMVCPESTAPSWSRTSAVNFDEVPMVRRALPGMMVTDVGTAPMIVMRWLATWPSQMTEMVVCPATR